MYAKKHLYLCALLQYFMMRRLFFTLLTLVSATFYALSQGNSTWWTYIENYHEMAIDQMNRYGVPASITLAQGLCESGAGRSVLAIQAHNHFGIKVGSNWTGPYIIVADDRPDDRFRKYKSDDESFEDHSLFLKNGQRYAFLFDLKKTDYKGWAKGLKKAGYATNPRYADMLIEIIENYNLSQFDSQKSSGRYRHGKDRDVSEEELSAFFSEHIVYYNNKTYMIIANSNDSWERIARETGVSVKKLLKYNELPKDAILHVGDVVYLEKKRQKADPYYSGQPHVVQAGESLYDIAQRYGIRLGSLYKMNKLPDDYVPEVGDQLKIR